MSTLREEKLEPGTPLETRRSKARDSKLEKEFKLSCIIEEMAMVVVMENDEENLGGEEDQWVWDKIEGRLASVTRWLFDR